MRHCTSMTTKETLLMLIKEIYEYDYERNTLTLFIFDEENISHIFHVTMDIKAIIYFRLVYKCFIWFDR